jgi:hypothetical protein
MVFYETNRIIPCNLCIVITIKNHRIRKCGDNGHITTMADNATVSMEDFPSTRAV